MKSLPKHWLKLLSTLIGLAAMLAIPVVTLYAQSVPQPVISISVTNTNQFFIQITNGVGFANYELYRAPRLNDPVYPWALHIIGGLGQTNFTANMGIQETGFFQVTVGLDWDGDGIANSSDADPSNSGIGTLSITIDNPTNGSTFN